MTLNEFIEKHPQWADLHVILCEGGVLKVYPGAETAMQAHVLEIKDSGVPHSLADLTLEIPK